MLAAAAVIAPAAAVGWAAVGRPSIPPDVLGLTLLSGAVEVAYFVLLSAAYRRGDLSLVYPIARGTAPLLAVVAGVALLGERLPPAGWLGVGLLLAGLVAVQRPWRLVTARAAPRRVLESAVPYAIGAGVAIATYTALDRVAVRLVEPWLYAGLLWPVMALGLVPVALGLSRRGPSTAPGSRGLFHDVDVPRAALGGLLTLAAYLLVLGALATAPLAVVAPLRESAIVLASGWGAVRLREAATRRDAAVRIGAAVLVVLGATVLAIAS
jgi:drug/metabolite transporter (DMT)-like permease